LEFLEELNESRDIKSGILPVAMLIRAVALSLKEVLELNGFYKDGVHEMREEINIGVAIALRKSGLMTPALLSAQNFALAK
jgi:pyruvate dehydrogenase E2 component (dihydrolipoamide acetyltransferase)